MVKWIECNPISKIDDILSVIEKYNPQITTKEADYLEIKIVSNYEEELWVEVSNEFSIFFGDWHTHYFAYEEEYSLFLNDLLGILENKKFSICIYKDGEWQCSTLSDNDITDESALRKEYGNDSVIKCNYWNKTKNVIYNPQI